MDEPVDQRRSDHLIAEDLSPGLEAAVGGDDDRASLIAAGDKGEQQVGGLALQRQVADLVVDQEPVALEAAQLVIERVGVLGGLEGELKRLSFVPLIVVDEVGYIPFDPEAANLMLSLLSARYERASMIVTSRKPFRAWGEKFGDGVTATAMIDRLVHHAEILALKATPTGCATRTSAARRRPRSAERSPAAPAPMPAERL